MIRKLSCRNSNPRCFRLRNGQSGFTVVEVLIAAAVGILGAMMDAEAFRTYSHAKISVDSTRALKQVEEQLVNSVWKRINTKVRANGCANMPTLGASLVAGGWKLGAYGSFTRTGSIGYVTPGPADTDQAISDCNGSENSVAADCF